MGERVISPKYVITDSITTHKDIFERSTIQEKMNSILNSIVGKQNTKETREEILNSIVFLLDDFFKKKFSINHDINFSVNYGESNDD